MPATVDSSRLSRSAGTGQLAPRLRVRPAPSIDPPLDNHQDDQPAGLDPLPLSGPLFATATTSWRRPALARRSKPLSTTNRQATVSAGEQEGGCSGAAVARRFVTLCVEVINGFRPAAQLRPLIAPHQFEIIIDQILRHTLRFRLASTRQRKAKLRRIRSCEPAAGVVETAAIFDDGVKLWAMAIRLERQPEGWRCVVAQTI